MSLPHYLMVAMAKEKLFSQFVSRAAFSHTSMQSPQYLVDFLLEKNNCNIATLQIFARSMRFKFLNGLWGF